MSDAVQIDGADLWSRLMEMAKIGPGIAGGNNRLAFSPEDDAARKLFRQWCEAEGLEVRNDLFGNQFATRKGSEELEPILIGSHLDTQPTGGRFDGILGVLGGLAALKAMNAAKVETRRPVVLVNWTNEEGAIIRPMMGSEVFTGAMTLEHARSLVDHRGLVLGDMLDGLKEGVGDLPIGFPVKAYVELHIEQGPILEKEGLQIGVVSTGIGFRRWLLTFSGQDAHAGPTPMDARRDAMLAAAHAVLITNRAASAMEGGRGTNGRIESPNGSQVSVASRVELTLDLRHENLDQLNALTDQVLGEIAAQCKALDVKFEYRLTADSPPVPFDPEIAAIIDEVAAARGFSRRRIVSGAGHDACNMARKLPAGLIFIPSIGGISHNEAEYSTPEDCAAGAQVLLDTVLRLAS